MKQNNDITANQKLNRITELFVTVTKEANELNIPISKEIEELKINTRAKNRLGCCKIVKSLFPLEKNKYVIEISERILTCDDKRIKEILCHELLHTCPGCMNHGNKWKKYCSMMSSAYGYEIKRTVSLEEMGIADSNLDDAKKTRYYVKCEKCGQVIERKRKCKLINNMNDFRCGKCGGKLYLYKKSTTSCR